MGSAQRIITDTNKGPLVQVLTLMFLVLAVLACLVRCGTKIYMVKRLKVDDILAVVSGVFAICQSVVVFLGSENGLGQPFETLSSRDVETFYKTQYASNSLFIASLLCSKLSGTMGLRMMSRRGQENIILVCEVVIGLWGCSAFFVNFFQCRLPMPWDYSDSTRCINRTAFWTWYSISNIITDVAIVAIMIDNARKIQTSWSKRILVICVFGSRIFVTPAAAAQIYYSNKAFASSDASFSLWEAAITMQLVQCLAIFTVCVPNLKPFLDSLESGQIRIDDLRRQGKTSSNGYPTYKAGHSGYRSGQSSGLGGSRSGQGSATRSQSQQHDDAIMSQSQRSQHSDVHEMVNLSASGSKTRAVAQTAHGQKTSWDGQSHGSHSSQTILVQQSWEVDVQNMAGRATQ